MGLVKPARVEVYRCEERCLRRARSDTWTEGHFGPGNDHHNRRHAQEQDPGYLAQGENRTNSNAHSHDPCRLVCNLGAYRDAPAVVADGKPDSDRVISVGRLR